MIAQIKLKRIMKMKRKKKIIMKTMMRRLWYNKIMVILIFDQKEGYIIIINKIINGY